jgi:hypothetical protein
MKSLRPSWTGGEGGGGGKEVGGKPWTRFFEDKKVFEEVSKKAYKRIGGNYNRFRMICHGYILSSPIISFTIVTLCILLL